MDAAEMDRRKADLALRCNVSQRARLFDRTIGKELAKDFSAWQNRQIEFGNLLPVPYRRPLKWMA